MSVEHGEIFYYPNPTVINVFDKINSRHPEMGNSPSEIAELEPQKLLDAGAEYILAGAAFLANHGYDEYLKSLGAITWQAIQSKAVILSPAVNMPLILRHFNMPDETMYNLSNNPAGIKVVTKTILVENCPRVLLDRHCLFFEPKFLSDARQNPHEALTQLVSGASFVRDLVHVRDTIDIEYCLPRAQASQAHFLLAALQSQPNLRLNDERYESLALYPKGIWSLPAQARYKTVVGKDSFNPGLN